MSTRQVSQEQEETRRQLLVVTAGLLLLLRRAVRRSPATGELRSDADRLYTELAGAYLVGRSTALNTSVGRVVAELEVMAPTVAVGALQAHPELLNEARRANRAARGYTDSWLSRALGLADSGSELPGQLAHEQLAGRLRMGAETEAAEAFNLARREAIGKAVARSPGLVEVLEQVWDVAWCKGTCDDCADLDGMSVPLGDTFPMGDPPLHPSCGCTIEIRPRS